jgi:gamma-glutamylcyclotransferase (GGCT)/AIG2-like uncharacterized protein YtfP
MNRAQMEKRLKVYAPGSTAKSIGIVFLKDYLFDMNKIGSIRPPRYEYASIAPQKGEEVEGVLWEVNDKMLETLDTFEGVSRNHYTRELLDVSDKTGAVYKAYVYIAHPDASLKTGETGRPTKEYLERIVSGARDFGLSAATIEKFEKWPTSEMDR